MEGEKGLTLDVVQTNVCLEYIVSPHPPPGFYEGCVVHIEDVVYTPHCAYTYIDTDIRVVATRLGGCYGCIDSLVVFPLLPFSLSLPTPYSRSPGLKCRRYQPAGCSIWYIYIYFIYILSPFSRI